MVWQPEMSHCSLLAEKNWVEFLDSHACYETDEGLSNFMYLFVLKGFVE